jgi:hypothetical protein
MLYGASGIVVMLALAISAPRPAPKPLPVFDENFREAVVALASVTPKAEDKPPPVPREPIVVRTIPIIAAAPAQAPPSPVAINANIPPDDEATTRKGRLKYLAKDRTNKRDICARHGMRKVVTRGGRSWRCR